MQNHDLFDAWRVAERDAEILRVQWKHALDARDASAARFAQEMAAKREAAHSAFMRALEHIAAMSRALRPPPA